MRPFFFRSLLASAEAVDFSGKGLDMSAYRIELAAGQTLFREGDPATTAFLIARGSPRGTRARAPGTTAFLIDRGSLRVTALREGVPVVLGDLHAGTMVGEMAVLDDF